MKFSIITPSFRASNPLRLCIASVADQDVPLEHLVHDSCSDDGTQQWLPGDPRVRAVIERDAGMYDAINRGLRRSRGELLAYLNADEQYLPGALQRVLTFFEAHPRVDVVFGDVIVIDGAGSYLCERRAVTPQRWHTLVGDGLSFLTCATFFRRRIVDEQALFFSKEHRNLGDVIWALDLLQRRARMAVLPEFLATFTCSGLNLSLDRSAATERTALRKNAPWGVRALRPLVNAHFKWRRWRRGGYRCIPHDYAIYTSTSPGVRRSFRVEHPTWRWQYNGGPPTTEGPGREALPVER